MVMNDITALLTALKSKEAGAGSPDEANPSDSPGADDSAPEDEGSPEDSAEDNAKIVEVLQDQYPQIYAKISKQIEAEDSAPDSSDSGSLPDDMNEMA